LAFFLSPSPWLDAQTVRYDLHFRRWGQFYLPWQDWHWWKAQAMAESGIEQGARSRAGAIGIMQLMPETARELGANPFDPESNIQGGIKYDAKLLRMWGTLADRRELAFAAYNAGPGRVAEAVRRADGMAQWATARVFLPAETVEYVARVGRFYVEMK
jgi:membrane-bound lytic murein transglycosylase F